MTVDGGRMTRAAGLPLPLREHAHERTSSLGPSLQGQCGRDGVLSQADVVRAPVGIVDGRLVRLCERPLVPDLLLGHVPPEDGLHPAAGRDLHRRAERDVNREPGEHADRFGPRLDGDVHLVRDRKSGIDSRGGRGGE